MVVSNLLNSTLYDETIAIGTGKDSTYNLSSWIKNSNIKNIEVYKLPDVNIHAINLGRLGNFDTLDFGRPVYLNIMAVIDNPNPVVYPSLIDHLTNCLTLAPVTKTRAECLAIIQNAADGMSRYDGSLQESIFAYGIKGWRVEAFKNYKILASSIVSALKV